MESQTSGEVSLTRRERQIAELLAWGAAKKEVPSELQRIYGGREISFRTVENITKNIYAKLHIQKASELSAWWFCKKLGVDSSLSPLSRTKEIIIGIVLLLIILPQTVSTDITAVRPGRTARTTRIERVTRTRRKD